MNKIVGCVLAFFCVSFLFWLYGHSQYKAGQAYAIHLASTEKRDYENETNQRIAVSLATTLKASKETQSAQIRNATLDRDLRDRNARITGLLNILASYSDADTTGSSLNDADAIRSALFGACSARAVRLSNRLTEMGGDAAILADQVSGLQGYIRATHAQAFP